MYDHRRHCQQQQQQHHFSRTNDQGQGGGGDVEDHHRLWQWQPNAPRRFNKKSTTAVRKWFVAAGRDGNAKHERWNSWSPLPTEAAASSSSSSSSCSPSPPQLPSSRDSSALPSAAASRRRPNALETSGGRAVEWTDVSKHFAGLPPYINDNTEKYKNAYSQANLPPFDHHLLYYGEMHKLHQNAYATRNMASMAWKPPPQLQRCCKPWQWNYVHGRQAGTCMNAYYLSDPERYANHANKVIEEDSLVCLDKADELSRSVWCKYSENRQSVTVYNTKLAMWCSLSALIKSRWPGCGLYMVGSTMNGFGGDVSDADFCLLTKCPSAAVANGGGCGSLHRAADELHRACGVQRLRWLMGLLDNEWPNGTADIRIVYAKVPILRFRWMGDSEMDVDLCCNNMVGIRNTHLLYCYSRLDYRVRPLVLTIKLWASCHNINDPKKMTLSSYSLVLMVINFLQCAVPPVLPSLQCIYGMKFSPETNIEFVHMHEQLPSSGWRSENKQSLGELLLQFFKYYNDFNYYNYAVSVRMGMPIQIETCRMAETVKNDPGQWKFIGIEEPFERTNTARSVHNYNVFNQILEVISKSYNKLKETKSLDSIFCQFEK